MLSVGALINFTSDMHTLSILVFGAPKAPYIVFRVRFLYGFMFVYIYFVTDIYIYIYIYIYNYIYISILIKRS